jgi:hypothetical protein
MANMGSDSQPQLSDDTGSLAQDSTSNLRSLLGKVGTDTHGEAVLRRASVKTDVSDSSSSAWSNRSRPAEGIEDWKQLLKDAETRAEQRLREAEERAEQRRLSDLKAAVDREERAEQRRLSDLDAAEQRRLSDLDAAERRLREAEERAEKRLREAEERAETRFREAAGHQLSFFDRAAEIQSRQV